MTVTPSYLMIYNFCETEILSYIDIYMFRGKQVVPRSSKFTLAAHASGIIFNLADSVGNPLQYKCCHGTHTRYGTSAIAQFIRAMLQN